mmetsp:Transcript_26130/g.53511  ORF Transcript_26130/g.53511 Transcript_26130/m.53511 type:complete len:104 (+) Transcript_26130:1389-1700(+)
MEGDTLRTHSSAAPGVRLMTATRLDPSHFQNGGPDLIAVTSPRPTMPHPTFCPLENGSGLDIAEEEGTDDEVDAEAERGDDINASRPDAAADAEDASAARRVG